MFMGFFTARFVPTYIQQLLRESGIREQYAAAEKAETLREVIASYETAFAQKGLRDKNFDAQLAKLPASEEAEAKAREALAQHEQSSPVADLQKTIGEYEAKLPVYQGYDALKAAFVIAEKEWKAEQRVAKQMQEAFDNAITAAASSKHAFDDADQTAREYRNRYYSGIYGEIAASLTEGDPCPVCGSTSHPYPAEKAADSVSKAQMEEAEKDAEEALHILGVSKLLRKRKKKSGRMRKLLEPKRKARMLLKRNW